MHASNRSNPVAAMTSKTSTRFFLVATAAYCALRSYTSACVFHSGAAFNATAFRLLLYSHSDAGSPSPSNSSRDLSGATLRLLLDGCPLSLGDLAPANLSTSGYGSGPGAIFELDKPVQANGFELFVGPAVGLPPGWLLEATGASRAGEWLPVAASAFRRSFNGAVIPYPSLSFVDQSPSVSGILRADLRPDWQWASQFVVSYGLATITFLVALSLAIADKQWHARWVFASHYWAVSILYATAAADYHLNGRIREGAAIWLLMPEHVVVAVGLLICEGR